MKRLTFFLLLFGMLINGCQSNKKDIFNQMVVSMNKECPLIIDEVTCLDSTSYNYTTNIFYYHYTISGKSDQALAISKAKKQLSQRLPQQIKSEPELQPFREHQVTLCYIYHSQLKKEEWFRVTITPDLYQ